MDAVCALRKPWLTGIVTVVILVAVVDCWKVSTPNSGYLLGGGEQESSPTQSDFQAVFLLPTITEMFMMAIANLGVVNCYEPAARGNNTYASNMQGYRGEQYLVGNGNVSLASGWTPKRSGIRCRRARSSDIGSQSELRS